MKRIVFLLIFGLLTGASQAQLARPVVGQEIVYTTKKGDTLLSVALKHRVAIEHLAFANGYPLTSVQVVPGTEILIPQARVLPMNPPKNGLVLNVPERIVFRFVDGKFVEFFPVAVGNPPDAKTPLGNWHIIEKIKNPTWYPPKWAEMPGPVGPGPDNPLGDRWVGLSAHMVGFHGTNNPINVGGSVTHGCVRFYPEHIRDLFEKVKVSQPVRIEYETAKLGRDKNGKLHLVTFEDVYSRSKTKEAARKILKKIGKEYLMSDKNFKGRVALTLGTLLDLEKAESLAARLKAQ